MWRNYVICVLLGLLLVTSGTNILLLRQLLSSQADVSRLQTRLTAAEASQSALQQQVDRQQAGASATAPLALPTVTISPTEQATLQQIETDVAGLRALRPTSELPLRFLDTNGLHNYFVDRFNRDYLPSERESDQKLLQTLGLIRPGDDIVQILLGVLLEQVIGIYDEDEKVMYVVGDRAQLGPAERVTFAHEFTHALQDQYFDLRALAPKHSANDDRNLAVSALAEGDALMLQRLWSQEKLTNEEAQQIGQGGQDSRLYSAPLFLREQLLFPYAEGFTFVRQVYQAGGGYPGVDEVFRNPPASTEQILHPEKYRTKEKPIEVGLIDLSSGALGQGWRVINSNILGELDLRLILQQLTGDRGRAVRAASGWGGDRWQLIEKDGRQALVVKSVWDTESDARDFFETWAQAMQARFPGAQQVEASSSRQALASADGASDVRRQGATVLTVISFDSASADAIANAIGLA